MAKIDVMNLPVEQVDKLFNEAARSDWDKARDWQLEKLGRKYRAAHPEFYPSEKNAELVDRYIAAMGLEYNEKSIDLAVSRLRSDGLLEEEKQ